MYYNNKGELTIPDLASHFRIASFDSLFNEFDETSLEYNTDSLLIGIYEYDKGELEPATGRY